jgi:hypothetical protein
VFGDFILNEQTVRQTPQHFKTNDEPSQEAEVTAIFEGIESSLERLQEIVGAKIIESGGLSSRRLQRSYVERNRTKAQNSSVALQLICHS